MYKTYINSGNLRNRDLSLVTLITEKEGRPSEEKILQWSNSYPGIYLPGELALHGGVSSQLFGWLTALGVAVEIIRPAIVRESYRTYINRIAENYNQTFDHDGPK